jgi:hypothetical protein
MKKALSPLISVTLVVVMSIVIASFVAPWMYKLVSDTTNTTGTTAREQVKCRTAGIDFDSGYGYFGVNHNFSQNVSGNVTDLLSMKVINTGTIDLYGFTIEAELETENGSEIMHYEPTDMSQKSASNPLRPSRSAIITANITTDINASTTTLKEVRVLNRVCPALTAAIEM